MDEHKENINTKDANVKMSATREEEEEKVRVTETIKTKDSHLLHFKCSASFYYQFKMCFSSSALFYVFK